MSPGPELAAALDSLDISQVPSGDLPAVLRARARQRSHDEAEFLRVIAEMGRRDPFDGLGATATREEQGRAADELRVALCWTRRAADAAQCYADDLVFVLPRVHAALAAGQLDPAKPGCSGGICSTWPASTSRRSARRCCPTRPG